MAAAFDKHRTGEFGFGTRRCGTVVEMEAAGNGAKRGGVLDYPSESRLLVGHLLPAIDRKSMQPEPPGLEPITDVAVPEVLRDA